MGHNASPRQVPEADRRLCAAVASRRLGDLVAELAVPRSYFLEPRANRRIGRRIAELWTAAGLEVTEEGVHRNVVARPRGAPKVAPVVLGAHYDSVPGCPGADDNASALAALLVLGELLARRTPPPPLVFVAFNAEEDGLLGSRELAPRFAAADPAPRVVHVLEMIGYRDRRPGAQSVPPGLPIALPTTGDFIGLVGDTAAAPSLERAVGLVAAVAAPPVVAVAVERAAALAHPVLRRSDHSPFWAAGVPAVMWTDTAEYRNPHYHRASDRPETLDLEFAAGVARLVLATVLADAAAPASPPPG